MSYRLLDAFRGLYEGREYRHRRSNLGDSVAMHLYEDLYILGRSRKYIDRVDAGISVINTQNLRRGIRARRGDGSFGELVPSSNRVKDDGFAVHRGLIATIEIGVEVKILMKAMIKQIDRVTSDLTRQAQQFRSHSGNPICVGIVGINRAQYCISYEGERHYRTDGKKNRHPVDEADDAKERLQPLMTSTFDEFLILNFEATNEPPYSFNWSNEKATLLDYGAVLARISQQYEARV